MGHFDNRSILYLHGYDSSSKGEKPNILRRYCTQNRLLIPDLPLSPQECMILCEDTLKSASNDTILIGASLGGFYAYYLASKYQRDCLLLNPVYDPAGEAKKLFESEESLPKKRMILEAHHVYAMFNSALKKMSPPPKCFVALGSHDTVIDPQLSQHYFEGAHFVMYEDDHYLLKSFELILEAFESYIQEEF